MQVGAPFGNDPGAAEGAILGAWRGAALEAWAKAAPRPLVLFLDEIDALQDRAPISVLRQLRDGYANRPSAFPASLALVGLRDVRDCKVASGGSARLCTSSPFNIKVRSLTMSGFSQDKVRAL